MGDSGRETPQLVGAAFEAAGQPMYVTDADGHVTTVNAAFRAKTGYDADAIGGESPAILDVDAESPSAWTPPDEPGDRTIERRCRTAGGDTYHAQETIAAITDDDGDLEGYVTVQTDVTRHRDRERQLKHYEDAVQGANDLISAVDAGGDFLFVNDRYRRFHGLTERNLSDANLQDTLDQDTWAVVEPYLDRALDGQSIRYQMTRSPSNLPDRIFDIRYNPLEALEDGDVTGVVATMRDITEQHERGKHLSVLGRVLRHNLRTTLNIVCGNAERIVANTTGETQAAAETIIEAGGELLALADKERDIVELVADPHPIQAVALTDVVERVLDRVRETHPDAAIDATVEPGCRGAAVPAIEQAFAELVENAIGHGGESPPTVTLEDHGDTIEFAVADDGPGIPRQDRSVLLGEGAVEPLYHGSGLGLWLVNWVVNHSGGRIEYDEHPSGGSVVRIVVNREVPDAQIVDDDTCIDDVEDC